jgi:Fe-S-cluster-containing dehydrogenase component
MTGIGFLIRTDHCIGCQACQVACREENGFSYQERWLELIRRKPQRVDGKLRNYHVAAPQLDKCGLCLEKDHQPLCSVVCPTRCLYIAKKDALLKIMEGNGTWQLHVS